MRMIDLIKELKNSKKIQEIVVSSDTYGREEVNVYVRIYGNKRHIIITEEIERYWKGSRDFHTIKWHKVINK